GLSPAAADASGRRRCRAARRWPVPCSSGSSALGPAETYTLSQMDVSIRGRNVELSDALRAAAEEKVTRLSRFLDGMDHVEIRFYEERNPRIAQRDVCEVTFKAHGHLLRARASAADPFAAIDRVVDKLEHQIEKLKGKLIGRSHPRRHGSVNSVQQQQDSDEEEMEPGQVRIVKNK